MRAVSRPAIPDTVCKRHSELACSSIHLTQRDRLREFIERIH